METLQTRVWNSTGIKFILVFSLFILLVLGACGGTPSQQTPGYATWTSSPSATPTCDPNLSLSTPSEWGATQLIVILYDPRPRTIGDQYLELETKEKIRDIPSFVDTIVPHLIQPGGQVSIFQLGYSSYDSARVARLYSYISVPQLYNTPSLPQTLTPLPSPVVTLTPGFGYVATKQAETKQAIGRAAVETANAAGYACGVSYWNTVVKLTATAWNGTATAEINDAEKNFATEITNHDKGLGVIETPFRTDELYYGGVYYGLSFASIVFQAECKNYSKCTLIIIDDLQVYREYNPDNLFINLSGVDIYAILPNCRDIDQPSCMKLREYWSPEFKKYGAEKVVYWNGVRAEVNLIDAIGR